MKGRVQGSLILLFTFLVAFLVNFQCLAETVSSGKITFERQLVREPGLFDLDHPLVNHYVEKLGKNNFHLIMKRLNRYEDMIRKVLRENGVPEELIFVSFVESGGHPRAIGRDGSGAAGLWQLTPSTARSIGLTVNKRIDERLDPFKSTFAVARFFRDLYEKFHSWPLVLAAFNMGENALFNKLAKHRTEDFNDLCKRGAIPKQTRNYIFKVYAAARLGRKSDIKDEETKRYVKIDATWNVVLTESVTMEELAEITGVPLDVLMKINPAFVSPFVRIKKGTFVTIPIEAKERYIMILGYGGSRY
ncbi:MAG: lytic transglycosylase domain-containing protein [Thermodesulforhabdaceae bacterium]